MTLLRIVAICLAVVSTATAAMAETRADLQITLVNKSSRPIACRAEIAHWFALDLALVPAGGASTMRLLVDTSDGTHFALNEKGEPLPVERAWCGFEGEAYRTRWEIRLERSATTRPVSRAFACAELDGMLSCE